jgi:hypothetical protein
MVQKFLPIIFNYKKHTACQKIMHPIHPINPINLKIQLSYPKKR